uniref:Putative ovule protein n=1 Tax=Solanum chacoense TaxID=4108 RepID=A0A0V0H5F8_SOLCH
MLETLVLSSAESAAQGMGSNVWISAQLSSFIFVEMKFVLPLAAATASSVDLELPFPIAYAIESTDGAIGGDNCFSSRCSSTAKTLLFGCTTLSSSASKSCRIFWITKISTAAYLPASSS